MFSGRSRLWITVWLSAHLWVGFQLSQEGFPVLQVVIDSVVSSTVHVCQDPLSILGNEFAFLHCSEEVYT